MFLNKSVYEHFSVIISKVKEMSEKVKTYAEVVSLGDELNTWTFISISQLLGFVFAVVYLVFFLLEVQYVRFTNVYVFWAIFWAIGAFLFPCSISCFHLLLLYKFKRIIC